MEVREDPVLSKVRDVIENGKEALGQQEFIDLLYGDSLSTANLIKAFCYDCRAWYADGIGDCNDIKCPLYSKMPYAKKTHTNVRRCRNSNRIRNPEYPVESRLCTKRSLDSKKKDLVSFHSGKKMELIMRKKKYPQEITQKEITKEERSVAMFDTAVKKYENEKKMEIKK